MKAIKKISNTLSLSAITIMMFSSLTFAQPQQPDKKENMEARHIGFITTELQLTPEEAQVFWPVYNKYRAELDELRKKQMTDLLAAKVNFDSYTDEQVSKLIDDEMEFRQKELDLQRKYNPQFKKVLPVKKVAKFYRAEQKFKVNLIKDMQQENQGGGPAKQGNNPPKN